MENIKRFFIDNDQFARHSGIELLEIGAGYAKVKMVIRDYHLNGARVVHGGALFTLADFVFAAASNSHGRLALGINATIAYTKAVGSGILYAEAKEISLSNSLGNYSVHITDEQNNLVAAFQGTAFRKKDLLPVE